jgi:hypothetical protein
MTLTDAISIAIPAIALIAVIAIPGTPRWLARPSFADGQPRRTPIAVFLAILLIAAIVRALA